MKTSEAGRRLIRMRMREAAGARDSGRAEFSPIAYFSTIMMRVALFFFKVPIFYADPGVVTGMFDELPTEWAWHDFC